MKTEKLIKNYISNRKVAKSHCEEILGTKGEVQKFAEFYKLNEETLRTARAVLLLSYCETKNFSPDQLESYKLGLNMFYELFKSCNNIEEQKKEIAKQEKELKEIDNNV